MDARVDKDEVAKFAGLAQRWWDPLGPLAPLHAMNPTRVRYVRDQACRHFRRNVGAKAPLSGLAVLDVGCGAGLLAEPLARLGARVVGIDAAAEMIAAAQAHARGMELAIDYRAATLPDRGIGTFDIVLAMEVVEHVPDAAAFVAHAVAALRPNGLLVLATLNRTLKAFALAIVGAEYVLNWLPRGTHDWQRFVRPAELGRGVRAAGLRVTDVTGVSFDAATGTFGLSRDVDVNYLMSACR